MEWNPSEIVSWKLLAFLNDLWIIAISNALILLEHFRDIQNPWNASGLAYSIIELPKIQSYIILHELFRSFALCE